MKLLLCLPLLLLLACTQTTPAAKGPAEKASPSEIRCELLGIELDEGTALASFRATNSSSTSVAYRGYVKESPIYEHETQEAGAWQSSPIGWCGTGVNEYRLEPGETLAFTLALPMDGNSHRFSFGEPAIRTPAVSAVPK